MRFWDGDRSWWCTPGGGVDENESDELAALRELREEVGEAPVELGPCIWTRRHVGVFRGNPFDQHERIYLGHSTAFVPRPAPAALLEHEPGDIRWWSLRELMTEDEQFAPRLLPMLVERLLTDGPPVAPVDVGV